MEGGSQGKAEGIGAGWKVQLSCEADDGVMARADDEIQSQAGRSSD